MRMHAFGKTTISSTFGRRNPLGCSPGQVGLLVQQQEGGHPQAAPPEQLHAPAGLDARELW